MVSKVLTSDFFRTRCDNQTVNWELVRAGCGIGFGQIRAADGDALLEQLMPELPIDPLPVWLAAHETMRQSPRIRWVWDQLVEGLTPELD